MAAVLPCQLGYAQIGTALACKGRSGANSNYAEWIKTYSPQEFLRVLDEGGDVALRVGSHSFVGERLRKIMRGL